MADATPSTPYGTPYFSSVKADTIDPQSNIGAGDNAVSLSEVTDMVTGIGKPNGAAKLDQNAQLTLQGESALGITPATAASGTTPATPAKLKPLLPLDETSTVGNAGNTLGDAVTQAEGAVQANGGDASNALVLASGASAARTVSDRASDALSVQDFGANGTAAADVPALTSAAGVLAVKNAVRLHVASGLNLTMDGSLASATALGQIIPVGSGTLEDAASSLWALHPEHLPYASMFPPTVLPQHLVEFHQAIANFRAGTIPYVYVGVMGDSIFATASNMVSHTENAMYAWMQALREQFPDVTFRFKNCAIGGTTWYDMASDTFAPPGWMNPTTAVWKTAVAAEGFHLLLLHSAGNDVDVFDPVSVDTIVRYFQGLANPPSVVVGLSYTPSKSSTTSASYHAYWQDGYQNGLHLITRWLRGYCLKNGVGFLDFYRWKSMIIEGVDPEEMALEQIVPDATTSLPAFGSPVTSVKGQYNTSWSFPAVKNGRGDSADTLTDFAIAYALSANPGLIGLSIGSKCTNTVDDNDFYVFFNDASGKIAYSWSDGLEANANNRVVTDIPVPTTWPAYLNFMVKGNQVVVQIWQTLSNTTWTPGSLVSLGTGFTTIFAGLIPRFGGAFTPGLFWSNPDAELSVYNLCIGNQVSVTGGGRRYMPWATNDAPAKASTAAGGSDAYHMNAYGVRDILAHVFRAQVWGFDDHLFAPVIYGGASIAGGLAVTSGNITQTSGSLVNGSGTVGPKSNFATQGFNLTTSGDQTVITTTPATSGAASFVYRPLNADGTNANLGYTGSGFTGVGFGCDDDGTLYCNGGFGIFGKKVTTMPKITGTKSTDPIMLQIMAALSSFGLINDATTS